MEHYRKKFNQRLYIYIAYMAIGAAMAAAAVITSAENSFILSFGTALTFMGAIRSVRHLKAARSDEAIRQLRIAETDERNIAISNRAKSAAFAAYISLTGTVVIVLQCMDKHDLAAILGASVCALVFIYWISYWIIRKRS